MTTTTIIFILIAILFILLAVLFYLYLYTNKKMVAADAGLTFDLKKHTNIQIKKLDDKTPKFKMDEQGEVELLTPDGKTPIHYWKLDNLKK